MKGCVIDTNTFLSVFICSSYPTFFIYFFFNIFMAYIYFVAFSLTKTTFAYVPLPNTMINVKSFKHFFYYYYFY